MLLRDDRVKAILVNIFGGITRCDEVARGIVEAIDDAPNKPIYVRLKGTNEEEGRRVLMSSGFRVFETAEEAMEALSREVMGGGHTG
jgi:succinyl-CoA synthetase beta subunit